MRAEHDVDGKPVILVAARGWKMRITWQAWARSNHMEAAEPIVPALALRHAGLWCDQDDSFKGPVSSGNQSRTGQLEPWVLDCNLSDGAAAGGWRCATSLSSRPAVEACPKERHEIVSLRLNSRHIHVGRRCMVDRDCGPARGDSGRVHLQMKHYWKLALGPACKWQVVAATIKPHHAANSIVLACFPFRSEGCAGSAGYLGQQQAGHELGRSLERLVDDSNEWCQDWKSFSHELRHRFTHIVARKTWAEWIKFYKRFPHLPRSEPPHMDKRQLAKRALWNFHCKRWGEKNKQTLSNRRRWLSHCEVVVIFSFFCSHYLHG